MAMAKPTVTRFSPSYPDNINGLNWVKEADPKSLARVVADLLKNPVELLSQGKTAYSDYTDNFSNLILKKQLKGILETVENLKS